MANAINFLCASCLAEESPGGTASHITCFSRVGGAAMPRPSPEKVSSIGGVATLHGVASVAPWCSNTPISAHGLNTSTFTPVFRRTPSESWS